ncbi:precorrin-3B synthase [Thioclava sp. SK-1]|uniref:precorrin-3B synthase n=1 Tax=Thioclava sp. SK-1 TaxID=1889770 RepID=UPI0008241E0D|nr:precorrin-3B synthase [Thioclava sp. SK-1]OCX65986.1 precorrin-3B synthase [Thioclava sp. SK-1]
MSAQVHGWCPGALRPMRSGDGLVVRIRPPLGRLTQDQAAAIALAAQRFGNGLIDLSTRANLQLRGVTKASYPALIRALQAVDLIDADVQSEARRNIIVTPLADNLAYTICRDLMAALDDGPDLPSKFGFCIDTGAQRRLNEASADIRIERDGRGQVIIRADGLSLGAAVSAQEAGVMAVELARWFVSCGGIGPDGRGRMSALIANGARPDGALAATVAPARAVPPLRPGACDIGTAIGTAFGQLSSDGLAALAASAPLRITPWRILVLEGITKVPDSPEIIIDPDDPRLRISACTGAPGCLQAHAEIRSLARELASHLPKNRKLHVSGCEKGCAHPRPTDKTLVARPDGFALILDGSTSDVPVLTGLSADEIPTLAEFHR